MLELFSNREIAMGIWLIIFLVIIMKFSDVRRSITSIIRIGINKYIIIPFLITLAYSAIWVYISTTIPIWEWKYLKEIIFWVLFVGVPICFKAIGDKEDTYFSDIVRSNFKLVVFLEFLIGTYTFNIIAELFLIPIATILVLLNAVAATDNAYKSAEKLLSFLQISLVILVFYFTFKTAINEFVTMNKLDLFVSFLIPLLMTFLFIPLAYVFAVYAAYEIVFVMMNFRLPKDEQIRRRAKGKLIKSCKLSWKSVHAFKMNYLVKLYATMSEEAIEDVFEEFNDSLRIM